MKDKFAEKKPMHIEQIYTGCLSEASYYIESNGEAAIIDPLRDVDPYIALAAKRGAKIRYVFETHFHADFVSGHIDLSSKTGATIVYGPTTVKTGFEACIGKDGQEFTLGHIRLRLIHTPGHTMESACYLLLDEQGGPNALFSGDTLFIGDVGRPDLAQKLVPELTPEMLAAALYSSLREKIMPLPDEIVVYPGHGAGSACGKHMSSETSDTLGHQKEVNYALNPMLGREEFTRQILQGLTPPPAYFPEDVMLNINGSEPLDDVVRKSMKALSPADIVEMIRTEHAVIIDSRPAEEFAKGFIPGAYNIGIYGSFASWAGTLISGLQKNIVVVAAPGFEKETIIRLARVGFDHMLGFLDGGFDSWVDGGKPADTIVSTGVEGLEALAAGAVLDVRRAGEYDAGHLEGALNLPLDYIRENLQTLDRDKTYYVYCAAGYRSMIFISIMKAAGFKNLVNIRGGFSAMRDSKKLNIVATGSLPEIA